METREGKKMETSEISETREGKRMKRKKMETEEVNKNGEEEGVSRGKDLDKIFNGRTGKSFETLIQTPNSPSSRSNSSESSSSSKFREGEGPFSLLSALVSSGILKESDEFRLIGPLSSARRGIIRRNGILCNCCRIEHSIEEIAEHLGHEGSSDKASSLFVSDGRCLLDCLRTLACGVRKERFTPNTVNKIERVHYESVHCSICNRGFLSPDKDAVWCDHCGKKGHVSCMKNSGAVILGKCICSRTCYTICMGLEGRLRRPQLFGDGLKCSLLKFSNICHLDLDNDDVRDMCLLQAVVQLFHSTFGKIPLDTRDLIEDIIFNRWSPIKKNCFFGYFVMIMEKYDEVLSAIVFRLFGDEVAEIPFAATSPKWQGKGMMRLLMSCVEGLLKNLCVRSIVLPATKEAKGMWVNTFGFREASSAEVEQFQQFPLLEFIQTTTCLKTL